MAKSEAKAVEKLSFEEAYAELETIVAALEAGDLPLDESMKLFERGQTLVKHCAELLDRADLKIKQLSGDSLTDLSEA
jgi:exodeoxyribonuclease VII small subunit